VISVKRIPFQKLTVSTPSPVLLRLTASIPKRAIAMSTSAVIFMANSLRLQPLRVTDDDLTLPG
jgi:hypothetical protein